MLKKTEQKGFTIVELLIVIVVIGILAALVLNTFAGVQQKARDTERQTDVTSLATQLEAYYNDAGGYPQFSQIDAAGEATTLFKGMDAGAVVAPGLDVGTPTLVSTASTSKDNYGYQAFTDLAKTTACAADDVCRNFTLTYTKESDASVVSKNSLNQ